MNANIVYQYFKKKEGGKTIYIQVDTMLLKGSRLTVNDAGHKDFEEVEFGADIIESLNENGFLEANALEFHLILKGFA